MAKQIRLNNRTWRRILKKDYLRMHGSKAIFSYLHRKVYFKEIYT